MSAHVRRRRRREAVDVMRRASPVLTPTEHRTVAVDLEVTGAKSSTVLTRLGGRAVPYNTPADIGPFVETIAPGAFRASLKAAVNGIPLMLQHDDQRMPIGVSEAWTERTDGLHGVWKLHDSDEAQEAARLAQRGLLGYLSIRFHPKETATTRPAHYDSAVLADTKPHIHVLVARLLEVSLVSMPAYQEASIEFVRSSPARVAAWRAEVDRLRDPRNAR